MDAYTVTVHVPVVIGLHAENEQQAIIKASSVIKRATTAEIDIDRTRVMIHEPKTDYEVEKIEIPF